jgi:predicted Zn-dependent peptidase
LLDTHFNSALELLADITFDSVFPEKQIERERNVILEEMAMYYDAPEEAVQDEFDGLIFENHPLGRNILGTRDSIHTFHRANFKQFIREHLDTSRLIFSCVGNLPMKKVIRQAEKYLHDIPQISIGENRLLFQGYHPRQLEQERNLTQAQCAIGRDAFSLHDERRLAFLMLTNILGGPAMNSRLNLTLREKYGLVYNIEADYNAYTDTGLFGIYFGTDPRRLYKSIGHVLKELKMLQIKPLGSIQLHRAKEQLMGQIAMGSENNQARMLIMGKSLLDERELETLDSIYQKINRIKADELQSLAQEMFDESQLSILSFVPKK